MKIGDEVYIHGYVDEIRKDTIIIRNKGGYFGTVQEEVVPSAQPKTGEWVDIDNYYRMATCSRCHKVTMFEKWGEYTRSYNYCPNCGADMRGEQDEH